MRIYVRNRLKYDPSSTLKEFLFIDFQDFASTTIAHVKEAIKKKTKNSVKIEDLFYNNKSLADDRSIAHYNIQPNAILETTSNPLWAACIYTIWMEVQREKDAHPEDEGVQKWTNKSIIRKRTILATLFNSKQDGNKQPPYFETPDRFIQYIENLGKKGAVLGQITRTTLYTMYDEYLLHDETTRDPIHSFVARQRARVLDLDIEEPGPSLPGNTTPTKTTTKTNTDKKTPVRKKKGKICQDCEESVAEIYCVDCASVLCLPCSTYIHVGAIRSRHHTTDVNEAPVNPGRDYMPHAYKAAFALLCGMYSGLQEVPVIMSMKDDEVKSRSQPCTDTDLFDKGTGRYISGFGGSMDNTLLAKGLVLKEASAKPSYTLTESGKILAERCTHFHVAYQQFLGEHSVPHLPRVNQYGQNRLFCGDRKLCLLIDEQERDRERLVQLCQNAGVLSQIRRLGAGDYLWILVPVWMSQYDVYNTQLPDMEKVLPYIVERKSWDDLNQTLDSPRFKRQVANMKRSKLENKYYLIEGSIDSMLTKPTAQRKQFLHHQLDSLMAEDHFYVNHTSTWLKTAQWLLQMTTIIAEEYRLNGNGHNLMTFTEFKKNVASKQAVFNTEGLTRKCHVWRADHFINVLYRESTGEKGMLDLIEEEIGLRKKNADVNLLVIQDLLVYNKNRQKILNRCLEDYLRHPAKDVRATVSTHLADKVHQLVHYDVPCYWQLCLQVYVGVHIYRTESDEDTRRMRELFLQEEDPGDEPIDNEGDVLGGNNMGHQAYDPEEEKLLYATDSQSEEFMLKQALLESAHESSTEVKNVQVGVHGYEEKTGIHNQAELLRLANELSGQNMKPVAVVYGSQSENDPEDDQLKLALEMSMRSSHTTHSVKIDGDEDEDIKLAIELSKKANRQSDDDDLKKDYKSQGIFQQYNNVLDERILGQQFHDHNNMIYPVSDQESLKHELYPNKGSKKTPARHWSGDSGIDVPATLYDKYGDAIDLSHDKGMAQALQAEEERKHNVSCDKDEEIARKLQCEDIVDTCSSPTHYRKPSVPKSTFRQQTHSADMSHIMSEDEHLATQLQAEEMMHSTDLVEVLPQKVLDDEVVARQLQASLNQPQTASNHDEALAKRLHNEWNSHSESPQNEVFTPDSQASQHYMGWSNKQLEDYRLQQRQKHKSSGTVTSSDKNMKTPLHARSNSHKNLPPATYTPSARNKTQVRHTPRSTGVTPVRNRSHTTPVHQQRASINQHQPFPVSPLKVPGNHTTRCPIVIDSDDEDLPALSDIVSSNTSRIKSFAKTPGCSSTNTSSVQQSPTKFIPDYTKPGTSSESPRTPSNTYKSPGCSTFGDVSSSPGFSTADKYSSNASDSSPCIDSSRKGNTRCGACKQMGHTKTWKQCPNYFSQIERERRQGISDKRKRNAEVAEENKQKQIDTLKKTKDALAEERRRIQEHEMELAGLLDDFQKKKKQKKK